MSKNRKLNDTILRWWERARDEIQDIADNLADAGWSREQIIRMIRPDVEESIPLVVDIADALIEPKNAALEALTDHWIEQFVDLMVRRVTTKALRPAGRAARRSGNTLHRRRARMRAAATRQPAAPPAPVDTRRLLPPGSPADVPGSDFKPLILGEAE